MVVWLNDLLTEHRDRGVLWRLVHSLRVEMSSNSHGSASDSPRWPPGLSCLTLETTLWIGAKLSRADLPQLQYAVQWIAGCTQLRTLCIRVDVDAAVSAELDLQPLARLAHLSEFSFQCQSVTPRQAKAIRGMIALTTLSCAAVMPAEILAQLCAQPGRPPLLRDIDFRSTVFSDAHVSALQLPAPLEIFQPKWMAVGSPAFLAQLPALRDVRLSFTPRYPPERVVPPTDEVVSALVHCHRITRLHLSFMPLCKVHLSRILQALPLLEDLDLDCLLEPDSLRCFAVPGPHCTTLKRLSISGSPPGGMSTEELMCLHSLQSLVELLLYFAVRDASAVESLRPPCDSMPNLTTFQFQAPQFDEEEEEAEEEEEMLTGKKRREH